MNLTISRALSVSMPCWTVIFWRARPAQRRLDDAVVEVLDRHVALHELRLQHVDDGLHLEVVGRGDGDVLLVPGDLGLAVLEIVALGDLLAGLVERVVDLLQIDARHDVERRHAALRSRAPGGLPVANDGAFGGLTRRARLGLSLASGSSTLRVGGGGRPEGPRGCGCDETRRGHRARRLGCARAADPRGAPASSAADCDDGNPCTDDLCDTDARLRLRAGEQSLRRRQQLLDERRLQRRHLRRRRRRRAGARRVRRSPTLPAERRHVRRRRPAAPARSRQLRHDRRLRPSASTAGRRPRSGTAIIHTCGNGTLYDSVRLRPRRHLRRRRARLQRRHGGLHDGRAERPPRLAGHARGHRRPDLRHRRRRLQRRPRHLHADRHAAEHLRQRRARGQRELRRRRRRRLPERPVHGHLHLRAAGERAPRSRARRSST